MLRSASPAGYATLDERGKGVTVQLRVTAAGQPVYLDSFKAGELLTPLALRAIVEKIASRCGLKLIAVKDEDIEQMLKATLDQTGVIYGW
jgi:hypothetical protein